MSGKTLILERDLKPHDTLMGQMAAMIAERGWLEFTKQSEAAVIFIVKELYVNANEIQDYVVQVRGKSVSYDKVSIKSYYQITDMSDDNVYTEYVDNYLNLDQVIKYLCRPGADWKAKEHEAINFSNKELSRYGKAQYSFICAKLMPTTHVSDVIKDRVVLLYTIVKGKTIDVGQII